MLATGAPAHGALVHVDFTVRAGFGVPSLAIGPPLGADQNTDLHGRFVVDSALMDDPVAAPRSFTLVVGETPWTEALIDPTPPPAPIFPDNFISFLRSGLVEDFTYRFVDVDAAMIIPSFDTFSVSVGNRGMSCNICVGITGQFALPEPVPLSVFGFGLLAVAFVITLRRHRRRSRA